MKNLHILLYCIYLERNEKALCIKKGIYLYQWMNKYNINYHKMMVLNYSISQLKEEIKMFL